MKNTITYSLLTAATAFSAHGAVISIDFSPMGTPTQSGLAAAPDANGAAAIWNIANTGSPTVAGALDTSGTTTPVQFSINSRGIFNGPNWQELQSGQAGLFSNYLTSRANNSQNDLRTGSITGLIPGNAYDFYVYGQGDNFDPAGGANGGQNVGVRIGTDVRHTSFDGVQGGDGLLVEDIEYVLFPALIADATGTINFEHFNPGVGLHGTDPTFFDSDTGLASLTTRPFRHLPVYTTSSCLEKENFKLTKRWFFIESVLFCGACRST